MDASTGHESSLRSWIWIFVFVGIILFKGLLSFFVVADKGPPDWDYRPVKDVPAQSEYATYPLLPFQQHVRGHKGE
jgi:heme/copper-type cytochrome/quinol oxidase subunit 3